MGELAAALKAVCRAVTACTRYIATGANGKPIHTWTDAQKAIILASKSRGRKWIENVFCLKKNMDAFATATRQAVTLMRWHDNEELLDLVSKFGTLGSEKFMLVLQTIKEDKSD